MPVDRKAVFGLLEDWAASLTASDMSLDSATGFNVTDQYAFNILLAKGFHPLKHHSVSRKPRYFHNPRKM